MKSRKSSSKSSKKMKRNPAASSGETHDDETVNDSTVYEGFEIYEGSKRPTWHPVKCMRYVFFRMISGVTITDAVDEIHWNASEFWHLVDLKRNDPFRQEYKRAKKLQGRAFADSVHTISEGRDWVSRDASKRVKKLVGVAVRKIANSKNRMRSKIIFTQLLADLREHDKTVILRNKLQMDASKWIARVSNPDEFSESSRLSLGSPGPTRPDGSRESFSPLSELSDDELREKIAIELKKARSA